MIDLKARQGGGGEGVMEGVGGVSLLQAGGETSNNAKRHSGILGTVLPQ